MPAALKDVSVEALDSVKIEELFWFSEKRFLIEHSFVVLKTKLSPLEQELMPETEFKYYVSEKDSMGVIWAVFYDFERTPYTEVTHKGINGKRPEAYLYMHKDFQGKQSTTIETLKNLTNKEADVVYEILTTNCHLYLLTLLAYLEMSIHLEVVQ